MITETEHTIIVSTTVRFDGQAHTITLTRMVNSYFDPAENEYLLGSNVSGDWIEVDGVYTTIAAVGSIIYDYLCEEVSEKEMQILDLLNDL